MQEHQQANYTPGHFDRSEDGLLNDDSLAGKIPHKDTMIGANTATQHLKNRLDSLRHMFDEEESVHLKAKEGLFSHIPTKQPKFEHHDGKIARNVGDQRKPRKNFQSQDTSLYASDNEVQQQSEDLRVFLSNKIQEIKDKINRNDEVMDMAYMG